MLRSKVNSHIKLSLNYLLKKNYNLPIWASWNFSKWKRNTKLAKKISTYQLSWDITDFGSDNFDKIGLTLFTLRNGTLSEKNNIQYAEKLMVLKPNQAIPYHYHKRKIEDIINRYGGELELGLYHTNNDKKIINYEIDSKTKHIKPFKKIKISEGQSIRLFPFCCHYFKSPLKNKKLLIIGEVSSVNNDNNDNFFPSNAPRFNKIVEDEKIEIPLWKDLEKL